MTTEKPIIDLSEWEECSWGQYQCEQNANKSLILIGGEPHRYFRRKPPLVKSLEEKVREAFPSITYGTAHHDLTKIARIIEEHYKQVFNQPKG